MMKLLDISGTSELHSLPVMEIYIYTDVNEEAVSFYQNQKNYAFSKTMIKLSVFILED